MKFLQTFYLHLMNLLRTFYALLINFLQALYELFCKVCTNYLFLTAILQCLRTFYKLFTFVLEDFHELVNTFTFVQGCLVIRIVKAYSLRLIVI
jgi:hypothetical protein